ncbi:TCR gamma alternate reading frame protein [Alligator mississippiensis]|nr:TCR gamma alternate reading frame protein [Alligator mississippiensis]
MLSAPGCSVESASMEQRWTCTIVSQTNPQTDGDAQELKQPQVSITKQEYKTAPIQCRVSGISLDSAYIHWYRQKPGKAPERILYLSSGKPIFDRDSDKGKFEAEKILSDSTCTLTIEQTSKDDAATYYCAYWTDTVLTKHQTAVQKLSLYSEPRHVTHSTPQHQYPHTNGLEKKVSSDGDFKEENNDSTANWARLELGGDAKGLTQFKLSITKKESKTALIECHVSGMGNTYIH